MVFVDQSCTILGQVNKNKPKLIKENKAIQSANKFRFSFWPQYVQQTKPWTRLE